MAEALAAAFADKLLTCSICLGEYEDPRVLPCYHTFCYGCICDHATRTITPKRTFFCPLCREEIQFPREGLVKLKKDFRIHTTKELLSQQQQHEVPLTIKETDVQGVTHGVSQVVIKCEKHPSNELKYYCEDDDTVVCGDCVSTEHYRHGIVPVEKAANTNRKRIKTVLVQTLPKLNMFKEAVAKETATEIKESQIMAASINKIKEQAQRIRRLVDQREQIMISEVFSACDIRKKQVGANKDTLELHHASLHSACNFAQELLTNGSASDIMIHTKALTERLTAMEKMPVPTPDTPTQISYSPGNISHARLDAMLGQNGQLYMTTLGDQCVQVYSTRGQQVITMGQGLLGRPCGVTLNRQGHVMLYQYGNTEGSGVGQLRLPRGVCTDSYGHIFIADNGNHRIVALSPQGQFTRYIATEEDGLKYPRALAINPAGQLVVAEGRGQVKTFQNLQ
ncbi:tripartite motif-containing protein 3-like [Lingula anatina]|uniref:Tripartite motif-containing protein 3-like n=1 Tax=Lingula anatina TaxID=7574 RepID=A0A1S3H010_LINAN|nr:tripartite motif-containing protein 3-like [Lingula anatina]|eukprot:XP_013379338.1 tripartite motif-containing protein 3-like [Lingula anatina]